jgi:hypothetical protein
MRRVSRLKRCVCEGALAAGRAVGGRRTTLQIGQGRRGLVLCAGHLLRRHAWLWLGVRLSVCGLLWGWRAGVARGDLLCVVLRVAVLCVHRRLRLASGFGIGLHGHCVAVS